MAKKSNGAFWIFLMVLLTVLTLGFISKNGNNSETTSSSSLTSETVESSSTSESVDSGEEPGDSSAPESEPVQFKPALVHVESEDCCEEYATFEKDYETFKTIGFYNDREVRICYEVPAEETKVYGLILRHNAAVGDKINCEMVSDKINNKYTFEFNRAVESGDGFYFDFFTIELEDYKWNRLMFTRNGCEFEMDYFEIIEIEESEIGGEWWLAD